MEERTRHPGLHHPKVLRKKRGAVSGTGLLGHFSPSQTLMDGCERMSVRRWGRPRLHTSVTKSGTDGSPGLAGIQGTK